MSGTADPDLPGSTLTLICQGATDATRHARFPLDEPLEPSALRAAGTIRLAPKRFDVALASPARAARQTATALQLDAAIEPLLADLACGRWAGCTLAAVAAGEPDALAAWTLDPEAVPHGGESVSTLIGRIAAWLEQVAQRPGRVVAVAHAGTLRAALVTVLGAPHRSFWRIDVAPLCQLRLQHRSGLWTLRSIGVEPAGRG